MRHETKAAWRKLQIVAGELSWLDTGIVARIVSASACVRREVIEDRAVQLIAEEEDKMPRSGPGWRYRDINHSLEMLGVSRQSSTPMQRS